LAQLVLEASAVNLYVRAIMKSNKTIIKKKGPNSFQKEALSLNLIENIVIEKIDSFWQGIDKQNDLGIDGIIFLGKNQRQTGQLIYVQAKYGDSYKYAESDDYIILRFPSAKLKAWRSYWNSRPEPVILVYIDSKKQIIWANGKDPNIFSKTQITLSKSLVFNEKSKSGLVKLFGRKLKYSNLPEITLKRSDCPNIKPKGDLKVMSKSLYKSFDEDDAIKFLNPYFCKVKFKRLGWNHITSPSRGSERIKYSYELLGAVKRIFETAKQYNILKFEKCENRTEEYLGIRSIVKFKERNPAVIQVVVLRVRDYKQNGDIYNERMWFLSVHEMKKD
jgi:hypothetical protein